MRRLIGRLLIEIGRRISRDVVIYYPKEFHGIDRSVDRHWKEKLGLGVPAPEQE